MRAVIKEQEQAIAQKFTQLAQSRAAAGLEEDTFEWKRWRDQG
jgi:hypothetical protein